MEMLTLEMEVLKMMGARIWGKVLHRTRRHCLIKNYSFLSWNRFLKLSKVKVSFVVILRNKCN